MTAPIRPRPIPRALVEATSRHPLQLRGDGSVSVSGITHDSRRVVEGDLYAALPGFSVHGASFAADAIAAGARAVLTDTDGLAQLNEVAVPVLVADDARAATGDLSSWVYGDPAADLLMVGITGTNGKTTTSVLVDAALRASGHVTGLIGTLGTRIGDRAIATERTTPEATDVHALLAVMRESGATAVTMEVSSHALVLHRVGGIVFDVVGFTNLSVDHLDFHGTMEHYFSAKASLFTPAHSRRAVVCVDDPWGVRLADSCGVTMTTLSTTEALADWQVISTTRIAGGGSSISLREPDATTALLSTSLPGRFNVANAALAFALARSAGVPTDRAARGIAECAGVPGRMQRVGDAQDIDVFVDYAHSPDAIDRVISTAREVSAGRVIVVVGGGGDRDRDKRPLMGRAASAADVVIVTDDNPRSEQPHEIRASILSGVSSESAEVSEVGDRREAIARAIALATPEDCVLVLGKGHETGQEIAGVKHPFDDRDEVLAALRARGGAS